MQQGHSPDLAPETLQRGPVPSIPESLAGPSCWLTTRTCT